MLIIINLHMEKTTKFFEDGEVTRYTFANGNYISIVNMILPFGKYSGNIGWNFGTYKNELYNKPPPLHIYNTKNQAKLIEALMTIIHDIKSEIFVEQQLF